MKKIHISFLKDFGKEIAEDSDIKILTADPHKDKRPTTSAIRRKNGSRKIRHNTVDGITNGQFNVVIVCEMNRRISMRICEFINEGKLILLVGCSDASAMHFMEIARPGQVFKFSDLEPNWLVQELKYLREQAKNRKRHKRAN